MDTIETKHDTNPRKEPRANPRASAGPAPSSEGGNDGGFDPESGSGLRIFAILLCLLLLMVAGVTAARGEPLPAPKPQQESATPTATDGAEARSPLQEELKATLGTVPGTVRSTAERFYEARDYEPVWVDRGGIARTRTMDLLQALSSAGDHGLDPATYGTTELRDRVERGTRGQQETDVAGLDVALTSAFLRYGNDLLTGRISPDQVAGTWHLDARDRDLAKVLRDALENGEGLDGTFRNLEPTYDRYDQLQEQYRRYLRLADEGGWTTVPEGPVLEKGDTVDPERYRALVDRLETEGYLASGEARQHLAKLDRNTLDRTALDRNTPVSTTRPSDEDSDSASADDSDRQAEPSQPAYDAALAKAVKRFQDRHGILEDGKVGPNTTEHMNISAADRAQQIALNLERWRWLPAELGPRHVEVNLPGFTLRSVEDGRVVQTMEVVVGKEGWATPIFTEQMERVVVNPYWNIPDSILHADLLPEILADPGYLASRNMEVVDKGSGQVIPTSRVNWASLPEHPSIRVRERPGPHNALGQIKFLFPNEFNVYLHDTPAQSAFEKKYRNLSHGCVRLERPLDFAGFVFANDPRWTQSRIRQEISTREHQVIELDEHLPVHFLYWTAFVDEDGRMNFRPDIYGYDAAHQRTLERQTRG